MSEIKPQICQTIYSTGLVNTVRYYDEGQIDRWLEREKRANPRAGLFIDGRCVWSGRLNETEILEANQKFQLDYGQKGI